LVGLAVWKADRPAVAPLLVVFGAAMFLLGAFYPRIEASVEATKDGVKAVVREVERVALEQGLSSDEFAEFLTLALERFQPSPRKPTEVLDAARRAVEEAASDPGDSPLAVERRLANAVTAWLTSEGWAVEDHASARPDIGYDMLALREDEELLVELKASRSPLPSPVIRTAAALRETTARIRPRVRTAVVLSARSPAPTASALHLARQLGVEIYRIRGTGERDVFVGQEA
jgi:hypothetical protein